jgi:hypothetical protein
MGIEHLLSNLEGKGEGTLVHQAMTTYEVLQTSALDGGGWSALHLGHLIYGEGAPKLVRPHRRSSY